MKKVIEDAAAMHARLHKAITLAFARNTGVTYLLRELVPFCDVHKIDLGTVLAGAARDSQGRFDYTPLATTDCDNKTTVPPVIVPPVPLPPATPPPERVFGHVSTKPKEDCVHEC